MRARIAAVLGRPTPMKHECLPARLRAATIVCISALVGAVALMFSPQKHVLVHPSEEAIAVATDRVPLAIEIVIALGDAVRVGRARPAGNLSNSVNCPAGQ